MFSLSQPLPRNPNESPTPVKTIDELPPEYQHSAQMAQRCLNEKADYERMVRSYPDPRAYAHLRCPDAESLEFAQNFLKAAALASLLPAAVKALEELVGFHGRIDQENIDKCRAILQRISEATKAVEGKR